MILRMLKNTVDGIGLMLLRMVPDSILIPRIEAQMMRKEETANRALEDLATFVKRSERELSELQRRFEQEEMEIQALVAKGLTAAAGERMEAFETMEAEYQAKKDEFESGKLDFETSYEEAKLAISEMQKKLKAIKNDSARARATAHLNELRKSVSSTRFESGGLVDDLNLINERNRDRLDRAAGTKMMLDKETGKTKERVEETKAVKAATNEARLARFAAKRNIALPGQTEAKPAPILEEKNKA
jgi:phage shock protein A